MQLWERMARTSLESLTLMAAGVAAAGEDLGDATTVLLPDASDIPSRRRDVNVVWSGEAAEQERRQVGAPGEAAEEQHGQSRMEDGELDVPTAESSLGEDATDDEVIEDGDRGLVGGGGGGGGGDRGEPIEGDSGATGTGRGRRGGGEVRAE
uniref:Uncharacterized protein n=1 Tax=Oryza meridionalis TaxID=40149 RepID=A0A0E0EKQ3_9ORYZ